MQALAKGLSATWKLLSPAGWWILFIAELVLLLPIAVVIIVPTLLLAIILPGKMGGEQLRHFIFAWFIDDGLGVLAVDPHKKRSVKWWVVVMSTAVLLLPISLTIWIPTMILAFILPGKMGGRQLRYFLREHVYDDIAWEIN